MEPTALFFFAALTIRQSSATVRAGCEPSDAVITSLPAGTPVEMRFRLADGSDCVKVSATVEGKPVLGYVPASALDGLDQFERERSTSGAVEPMRALMPAVARSRKAAARTGDPALDKAAELLASNQPAQALELLEPAAQRYRTNPSVLLLTGLAAYRADQLTAALDYWKQSLDLAPNEDLARVYERVKREAGADQGGQRLYGMHVGLRYEGEALPVDAARAVLGELDEEYTRISGELGCASSERVMAVVQSRDSYLKSTGAAEWSGGEYDGRIHIAWADGKQAGPQTRRALAHEMVHACLAQIPFNGPFWPAWFQEGLAQRLSGDTLTPAARDKLRRLAQAHQIPPLQELRQDWSRLSMDNARLAYDVALAAVDSLYENYAAYGIRNILNNPSSLDQITADLDKKLGL
jgi:tetratricopeptide (TPR) repeat protein